MEERDAMRARTWREAKWKLLTRQSQIPSRPKSVTNEFGSAVAVATYIVHNLNCFWQIRMISVRSVTDSTD